MFASQIALQNYQLTQMHHMQLQNQNPQKREKFKPKGANLKSKEVIYLLNNSSDSSHFPSELSCDTNGTVDKI